MISSPISVMVVAVRELFGNAGAPMADPSWPLQHAVPVAFLMSFVLLVAAILGSLRRFRARTSD